MADFWLEEPTQDAFEAAMQQGALGGIVLRHDTQWSDDAIGHACDKLAKIGGYVSQEITPAKQRASSIHAQAEALHERIGRPNLMVALPSSDAGIDAMGELVSRGISVHATWLFSTARALRTAEGIASRASGGARGILSVPVSPFDRSTNAALKAKGLAQNRIGFFVATKIYNQIDAMGDVPLSVMFADLDDVAPELEPTYYLENLNLPGAHLALSASMHARTQGEPMEESFHFQTRHLDAFFGYLAPAGIHLTTIEETLFREALS